MTKGQKVKLKEHDLFGVVEGQELNGKFFEIKWDNGTMALQHIDTIEAVK